ncbi:hypothetical protein AMJ40_07880 [candidate division TA06 bacterium DG_26]|uniref:Uncharacterized protein n=1 Tax=candidate division TA06 bacterium DG_26 TaxID=1703771 RepID=A0A0S7WDJ1_UNCT6|nr:MAG: hypothetical protein AMJ40_07880 [candidate division TA06 bacterium DG_26]
MRPSVSEGRVLERVNSEGNRRERRPKDGVVRICLWNVAPAKPKSRLLASLRVTTFLSFCLPGAFHGHPFLAKRDTRRRPSAAIQGASPTECIALSRGRNLLESDCFVVLPFGQDFSQWQISLLLRVFRGTEMLRGRKPSFASHFALFGYAGLALRGFGGQTAPLLNRNQIRNPNIQILHLVR